MGMAQCIKPIKLRVTEVKTAYGFGSAGIKYQDFCGVLSRP